MGNEQLKERPERKFPCSGWKLPENFFSAVRAVSLPAQAFAPPASASVDKSKKWAYNS